MCIRGRWFVRMWHVFMRRMSVVVMGVQTGGVVHTFGVAAWTIVVRMIMAYTFALARGRGFGTWFGPRTL